MRAEGAAHGTAWRMVCIMVQERPVISLALLEQPLAQEKWVLYAGRRVFKLSSTLLVRVLLHFAGIVERGMHFPKLRATFSVIFVALIRKRCSGSGHSRQETVFSR